MDAFNGVKFHEEARRKKSSTYLENHKALIEKQMITAEVFIGGAFYGHGKMFFKEDRTKLRYEGYIVKNQRHGVGTTYDIHGNVLHSGIYEEDKFVYGRLQNDNTLKIGKMIWIVNEYLLNGEGISFYDKHGKAVHMVGEFSCGKLSGEGREYDVDGSILNEGVFKNGRCIECRKVDINCPYMSAPKCPNGKCCICMDNSSAHIFTGCGHLCVCKTCLSSMGSSADGKKYKCPICRAESAVIQVFTN